MRRSDRQRAAWLLAATPVLVAAQAGPPPVADDQVRTLEQVNAIKPEDEEPAPVRDPFAPPPNRFARRFKNPPTPEEVALHYNGYLMYGVIKGGIAGGRWLNKATGGPDQVQSAQARAAPLDAEQADRALRWAQADGESGGN